MKEILHKEYMLVQDVVTHAYLISENIRSQKNKYAKNKTSPEHAAEFIKAVDEFLQSIFFQQFYLNAFNTTYHKYGISDEITQERFIMQSLYTTRIENLYLFMLATDLVSFPKQFRYKLSHETRKILQVVLDSVEEFFESPKGFRDMFQVVQMYYFDRQTEMIEIEFWKEVSDEVFQEIDTYQPEKKYERQTDSLPPCSV